MVKKVIHILLAALLLLATTGMAVSKHYCRDSLVSTVLFGEAKACCDSDSCCHNEFSFFQLDEDYSAPSSYQNNQVIEIELFAISFETNPAIFGDKVEISFFTEKNPPPPPKFQTLLSMKQAFLL
jgi:hypothetical protein